jgi:hypothetical protein
MEGFSFATPVTGLSRPNTGKDDDDDDDDDSVPPHEKHLYINGILRLWLQDVGAGSFIQKQKPV